MFIIIDHTWRYLASTKSSFGFLSWRNSVYVQEIQSCIFFYVLARRAGMRVTQYIVRQCALDLTLPYHTYPTSPYVTLSPPHINIHPLPSTNRWFRMLLNRSACIGAILRACRPHPTRSQSWAIPYNNLQYFVRWSTLKATSQYTNINNGFLWAAQSGATVWKMDPPGTRIHHASEVFSMHRHNTSCIWGGDAHPTQLFTVLGDTYLRKRMVILRFWWFLL